MWWCMSLRYTQVLLKKLCIPVLEQVSGLKFNQDFFAGYSPERINPGDKLTPPDQYLKKLPVAVPQKLQTL